MTDRPSPTDMLGDPKLVAAAKRIYDDHYRLQFRRQWEDLPEKPPLGEIDYRFLCLSFAWSAFEAAGDAREILRSLPRAERLEIFGDYCKHCGSADPGCQCWNDE